MKTVILSDLHLGGSNGSATDGAFVSFLEWLAARVQSEEGPWRLVVLGDFFDLLHPPTNVTDPLSALHAVAAGHRSVLAVLGGAASSGIHVDLVPGNHDSELLDSDLQEHLRVLVGDAAGVDAARLKSTFHIRPWFLIVPGLLYAEHGSQYHALNAVADPLAPFGRWSRRMPPGAVLDLGLRGVKGGARAAALLRLLPALLRSAADRRTRDAATVASLQAYAEESGLSPAALAALRNLSEDSPVALGRNLSAALLRHANHVESRQQRAALAINQILDQEGQGVPVYVFGHTHRVAQRPLPAGDERLQWLNTGAWADGSYCFAEVEDRAEDVVARLRQWDTNRRSAVTISDRRLVAQEGEPTTRARKAGSRSADVAATP